MNERGASVIRLNPKDEVDNNIADEGTTEWISLKREKPVFEQYSQ